MRLWYLLSVWLHILSASVWIGGMVFIGLVLVPVIRGAEFDSVRTSLMYRTGLRLRWMGWIAFVFLVLTGVWNIGARGYGWHHAFDGTLWAGTWGTSLAVKLCLVTIVLFVSAWHDFHLGPRAASLMDGSGSGDDARRLRRIASYVGRLMLLLSLIILAVAVMLVRGTW